MKLREIVAQLIDSQDNSVHAFRRLYNLGVWGMRTEFNLDVTGQIKSVLLDVNPNKTVQLPCDYVSYTKIGVINQHNEVVCFKRNDKLTNYHQEYFNSNNRTQGVPTLPNFGFQGGLNGYGYFPYLYLNYWYGNTSYNLFGLGSGTADVGQYKVDEQARIILFSPHLHWTQILLEYLSDGCDEDNDDYEVDIRAAEAVKSYLRWQDVIDRPKKASPATVRMLKDAYFNEKRKSRMRLNPVVLNEMQNIERRSWKLVAKA